MIYGIVANNKEVFEKTNAFPEFAENTI